MSLEISLLALVVAGVFLCFAYCMVTGICPCSSTRKSRRAILNSVPKETRGIIYELGAGWGALAFPLALRCRNAKIVAYELSPVPFLFMRIIRQLFFVKNLKVYRKNFLKVPIADANFVICYLHPEALEKLEAKLDAELSQDATVISNAFELPNWQPTIVEKLEDLMCPQVFVYQPVRCRSALDRKCIAATRRSRQYAA